MRPVRSSTSSTRFSRCSASSRSAATPNAVPPAFSISSIVSAMVPGSAEAEPPRTDSEGSWLRAVTTTVAPSAANR